MKRKTYECIDAVRQFHERNGAVINLLTPSTPLPADVGVLRMRLIMEELGETAIAIHENNLITIADGLADLLYVVAGTAVSYGLPMEDAWQDPEGILTIKPAARVNALAYLGSAGGQLLAAIAMCTNLCNCGRQDCEGAECSDDDWKLMLKALHDMEGYIAAIACVFGIPLKEVFFEVHRSNLTKRLGGAKPGDKYAEGGGKGEGFEPPNLAAILTKRQAPPHPAGADQGQHDQD
jgi:predicted HAD superfamily Cof-like phosphohydrolase